MKTKELLTLYKFAARFNPKAAKEIVHDAYIIIKQRKVKEGDDFARLIRLKIRDLVPNYRETELDYKDYYMYPFFGQFAFFDTLISQLKSKLSLKHKVFNYMLEYNDYGASTEAAAEMGITPNNYKQHRLRARAALKELL